MPLQIVTCQPHQQSRGDYAAFVQFNAKPPSSLRDLIKKVGKGAYRQPPPGFERSGWHIKAAGELARSVEERWPSFAKALMQARHTIKHHPEQLEHGSEAEAKPSRRGRGMTVVKGA